MVIAKGNAKRWRARRDSNPQPSDPKHSFRHISNEQQGRFSRNEESAFYLVLCSFGSARSLTRSPHPRPLPTPIAIICLPHYWLIFTFGANPSTLFFVERMLFLTFVFHMEGVELGHTTHRAFRQNPGTRDCIKRIASRAKSFPNPRVSGIFSPIQLSLSVDLRTPSV